MKFIHISDLHIGKRVHEYSMIEDQKFILNKIIEILKSEAPCELIIAGDVYDKAVPSAEAVELFDSFLTCVRSLGIECFIISGNHDSPERLSFGRSIMSPSGIHISPVYSGVCEPIVRSDEYGNVNIYLLPFIKPSAVRRFFDAEIESYTDALRAAIEAMNINKNERNILVTHQFVTGARRSESEEISVGGSDNIDADVFFDFDYVALGHIHSPQRAGADNIRYSGTPIKYSFSEVRDTKSITVVEMSEKGKIGIREIPLSPLRDMKEIRGKYNDIMLKSFWENSTYRDDYMHITLTDEEDIPDAISKLRSVYKNLMKLDYDNERTRHNCCVEAVENIEKKSPLELFSELFELQNNRKMTDEESEIILSLLERAEEVD